MALFLLLCTYYCRAAPSTDRHPKALSSFAARPARSLPETLASDLLTPTYRSHFSIPGVWAVQMEVIVNQALLSCAGDTLATILFALVFVNKVLLYSAQFQAIAGLNMPKAKGQHNNESQLKVVDAEEADGDEDDDDNDNGDGGLGEDEDELPSGGGHSDNPNSSNGNAKKGPEEGAGGAGEENGEEEDEEDGNGHEDGDEDGDEDGEDDDEDGEDGEEEEIVEEEEPAEDEEEDEEEEALQPPKKRKK